MNQQTQAAVVAMGAVIGAKYVKRSPAHIYFDVPESVNRKIIEKASKEFIRQTGIGVKIRLVKA
jgi:hypothetical protein